MAPKQGLVVTVSPDASAFFAGEVYTATITFTNSHPPSPPTPHCSAFASQQQHSRTSSSVLPSSWCNPPPQAGRSRPPSASHLGLAEYATEHLNSDEVPPSPYFGSTSGTFPANPTSAVSSITPRSPSNSPRRPAFSSTLSGGALPTPQSASFAPLPGPSSRSVSGIAGSIASTSKTTLPARKGLIGKPPPKSPPKTGGGGGLYAGGPRRPGGGLLRGHGRAQSMAVSTPDLLGRSVSGEADVAARSVSAGLPRRGHAKTRFGGSVAGAELPALNIEEQRTTSASSRGDPSSPASICLVLTILVFSGLPALIGEEEPSPTDSPRPNFPEDAAFPVADSSSSPGRPHFPRRPTFGHQRIPSNLPYSHPRAGFSNLSLADSDDSDYDPNDSNTHLPGNGFYGVGCNDTMESVAQADYEAYSRKPNSAGPHATQFSPLPSPSRSLYTPQAGHERHRSISQGNTLPRNSFLHPSNTIALLWAFAHLEGTFEVDETLIKPAEFLEVKRLLAGGTGGVGVGGGTLEESKKGGGWRSWLWSNEPMKEEGDTRGAASLEERKEKAVKDRSIPTFSCPPSILGVDLVLEPGESKSYTFSIRIPADLPPSFRGKAIKFNYHLVVGSNRVSLGPTSLPAPAVGSAKNSVSRVMRVPVRVYNHVGVTGARPFYDLTNPIIYQRDEATTGAAEDDVKVPTRRKAHRPDTGRPDFEAYAANLLDSVASNSPEMLHNASISPRFGLPQSPSIMEAPPAMRPEMSSHRGGSGVGIDTDEANGCKAAVEIVSRNSQKVSYDINKDGYMVAQLTLVKSAYRLGETVNGSVVINSGEGRVLRVSARLETHELVETTISTKSAPQIRQITRRLHSEHHETTLDSARIGFALAIPSGATPDFGTSGVKLQWSVRLSFLVIPPSPDGPPGGNPKLPPRRGLAGPPSRPPPPHASAAANGNGTPGRHGRSKSFAYGFEPAVPLTLPPPPMIAPSGAAHLMPVPPPTPSPYSPSNAPQAIQHLSYRGVPDLGFVPVLFSSAVPEPPPAPGPLQKTASGAHHRPNASVSMQRSQSPLGNGSTVLVPAKVETVECSIPIKVYPGNTPFRPTVTVFEA
ncbi:hypothetical protein JCM1841_000467 [Sporobolomyces salmonicolor]